MKELMRRWAMILLLQGIIVSINCRYVIFNEAIDAMVDVQHSTSLKSFIIRCVDDAHPRVAYNPWYQHNAGVFLSEVYPRDPNSEDSVVIYASQIHVLLIVRFIQHRDSTLSFRLIQILVLILVGTLPEFTSLLFIVSKVGSKKRKYIVAKLSVSSLVKVIPARKERIPEMASRLTRTALSVEVVKVKTKTRGCTDTA
ncbi:hypothetical protein KQX54_014378 [Cotesia glomerata]|uniref:Uncharacterized protein n=1 Tax=Cotesia glomerata TaxID=32391 RepID=A0AAV7IKV6_COTGL|nr:hypothetical protein KQX54_014378 [Cotesia glomerata]